MGAALSNDLGERVVSAIEQGLSCRGAAQRFGVSASSAIRWYQLYRETGTSQHRWAVTGGLGRLRLMPNTS